MTPPGPQPASDEDFFWARIDPEDAADVEGCWLWQGRVHPHYGYGLTGRSAASPRRTLRAHRFAYELFIGPLGDWHLDHLCRNRRCVNPWHLEKVDNTENLHRAWARCKYGHPLVEANVYVDKLTGRKRCATCRREDQRALRKRRREEQAYV